MNKCILTIVILLFHSIAYGEIKLDSITVETELADALKKASLFEELKVEKINALKLEANNAENYSKKKFDILYKIFSAYKNFQIDSAIVYLLKCKTTLHTTEEIDHLALDLDFASVYAINGNYINAKEILNNIQKKTIPQELLTKYYETLSNFYSQYGQSIQEDIYYQISEKYRDSLLLQLPKNSIQYQITKATKDLYSNKREAAQKTLSELLVKNFDDLKHRALIAYLLGVISKLDHNIEKQKYYFSISAIADIQFANKDNASIQDLALTYYELGDIDHAFQLIDKSIKDAIFCNVRYRIIEGTSFYPIINTAYQNKINIQQKKLVISLILISVLTVILAVGIIFIIKQIRKLNAIKVKLSETNEQLVALNITIHQNNILLAESNHIKEEYIAQFFDMCSDYIEKIDHHRKNLLKSATSKKYDDLTSQLKSTHIIDKEISDLYKNFDTIFLNLYPTFIHDFNSLLRENESIVLKRGELLNVELRIFALIRLGIDDSIKIASFLRYSLRTVYNYRTKMRNKANVDREQFEVQVKKIGLIDR